MPNDEINKKTDDGKRIMKIFDSNELAYTESTLFIERSY
jgi:hypothetical protein